MQIGKTMASRKLCITERVKLREKYKNMGQLANERSNSFIFLMTAEYWNSLTGLK